MPGTEADTASVTGFDFAEAHVRLEPDPAEVGRARRWAALHLGGCSAATVHAATLVVSELVTNVVLHARTPVELAVLRDGPNVRIEVSDQSPIVPTAKPYGPHAVSGRGLHLIEGLSEGWGVQTRRFGKVVWCELRDAPDVIADLEPGPEPAETPAPGDVGGVDADEIVEVRILGMDLAVYLEAQEHNDAVMREFALIVESDDSDVVPRRLVEFAREARRVFAPATAGIRDQIETAVSNRATRVDLIMPIARRSWRYLARLSQLLDEADAYCSDGDLLTLTSTPRIRNFRRWYTDQVRYQMEGGPATPWPGSYESP